MEFLLNVYAWLQSPMGVALLIALISISEFLGMYKGVASNSIFQLISNGLKKAKETLIKK
jgi:hypothetical protein